MICLYNCQLFDDLGDFKTTDIVVSIDLMVQSCQWKSWHVYSNNVCLYPSHASTHEEPLIRSDQIIRFITDVRYMSTLQAHY